MTAVYTCKYQNYKPKEHWYRGEADSSTTKLYSDDSLKSVFSTKTITVEFGCSTGWPINNGPPSSSKIIAFFAFPYILWCKIQPIKPF